MKRISTYLTILLLATTYVVNGQTISGKVSGKDNKPLFGATIYILGTGSGTITDYDGNFTLDVNKGDVLYISYTGYTTEKVIVGEETILDIT